MSESGTFEIIDEARAFTPVIIQSGGLLVGRARDCDLELNDPSIPLVLGGIKQVGDRFYFCRYKPWHDKAEDVRLLINGRTLRVEEALASGDLLVVGGYQIQLSTKPNKLVLKVSRADAEAASTSTDDDPAIQPPIEGEERKSHRQVSSTETDLVHEWLDRRVPEDKQKPTPENYLQPSPPDREWRMRFNWLPTKDLIAPWPVRFLFYCIPFVGVLALMTLHFWPTFFSPGVVANAHTRKDFKLSPPIAAQANGNTCRTCHSLSQSMVANCSGCHNTNGFQATMTSAHQNAGLSCVDCHGEHRGADYSAKAFAFTSCANCHNNEVRQTFNGRTVRTPHDGTFGYPVVDNEWKWKGLEASALQLKPEVAERKNDKDTEEQWRKKQFHAIHLYRVKAASELKQKDGQLLCSSCHATNGDRKSPRQTCGICHDGYTDSGTGRSVISIEKPNCVSCHVQHYFDAHRWGDLVTETVQEKQRRAIDKHYADAVNRTAGP